MNYTHITNLGELTEIHNPNSEYYKKEIVKSNHHAFRVLRMCYPFAKKETIEILIKKNMEHKHTITNPLKLTWDGSDYRVNKPNVNGGEFVSKEVANEMLAALKEIIETAKPENVEANKRSLGLNLGEYYVGGCGVPSNKAIHLAINAIKKATE